MRVPAGYRVVETPNRVGVDPWGPYWFRRRAQEIADAYNRRRPFPSYRVEVERAPGRWPRWWLVSYQNVLEKIDLRAV